jgi:archaea-specific DNA-binding protein
MENQPQHEEMQPREPNTIYVGKKPTKDWKVAPSLRGVNYVLACLTQINNGSNTVTVKARGKAISRAVDVAQVLTKRFATDIKVQSININTEQVKSTLTGGMSNVSSMEIKLSR